MRIEPEISGVVVVLLGDFSPAIFTPAWFALNSLLPEKATDGAQVQIVHPAVTAFAFDWLRLEVTPERFLVETVQAPVVRVRDFVVRVFKEHLFHTPVRAFGINRQVHFRAPSLAARDRIGRTLAPVEPWGTWGDALVPDGTHGGMTSLTMTQFKLQGRSTNDQVNVTVQPSPRIDQGRSGVYVTVNDHHDISGSHPGNGKHWTDLVEEDFESSLKRSDEIIDHIMSLADE